MFRLKFQNYPGGDVETWTPRGLVSKLGTINRGIESTNPGEAGLVRYDKMSTTLYVESGNKADTYFNTDLSAVERYIFNIEARKSDNSYEQVFTGVVDFTSIRRPELAKKISFNVVDKLSSIDLLENTPYRTEETRTFAAGVGDPTKYIKVEAVNITGVLHLRFYDIVYDDELGEIEQTIPSRYLVPGNIVKLPIGVSEEDEYDPGNPDAYRLILILKSRVVSSPYKALECKILPIDGITAGESLIVSNDDLDTITYYSRNFGGIDIGNYTGSGESEELVSYESSAIIESMVKAAWPSITMIKKGFTSIAMPLDYYTQLVQYSPLNKHPYDALKYLADTMRCKLFINRDGDLVVHKITALGTAGTLRSIAGKLKATGEYIDFWDKLCDGVKIKAVSTIKDANGDYLTAEVQLTKNTNGKPRNLITKEIFVTDETVTDQASLETYANDIAQEYFDFYGKRHGAYELDLDLDDDIIDWELLDRIEIDSEEYFMETIELDLDNRLAFLRLVTVAGYDWNYAQARPLQTENNKVAQIVNQTISINSTTGGATLNSVLTALSQLNTTPGILVQTGAAQFTKRNVVGVEGEIVITNGNGVDGNITIGIDESFLPDYTFNPPLSLSGTTVSLLYSDNFQLASGTTLDTIQAIKTDSDVQFGTLGLGGVIEAGYKLKVHGVAKFTSDIWVDGDIYIGGNVNQVNEVELNVQDRVINLNVGGTDTTAIGGGIDLLGTSGVSVASITHDGSYWQFSDEIVTPDIKVTNRTANGIAYFDSNKWLVEHSAYFSWDDSTKVMGIEGDIAMSGNKSIYNNFTSGIFGSGFILGYNITNSGGSYIELDNGRFRGTLAVHIFKKDIVKTANGYLLVTDSATVGRETQSPYLYVKQEDQNATFSVNDLLYTKDIDTNYNDGNGLLVKEIKSKVTWVGTETINSIVYDKYQLSFADGGTGTYQDYKTGMTIARVNKGFILLDASSEFSPFIDIYDDITTWAGFMSASKLKARSGKLSGVTSTNFGQLSGHGYWSNRVYLEGNCYVAGNLWAFTGGIGGTYSAPKVKISSSGMVVALDSASATFLGNSTISIGESSGWWGIAQRDSNGDYVFRLGSTNNIANWTFTKEKFSNGAVRLEASATLKGLAVTKTIETVDYDVIMIGDHSISNPTISENIEGKFFSNTEFSSASGWTIEQGPFSITQNATSFFNGDSTVNYNQSVLRVPAISLTATGSTDVDGHVSQGIYSVYIGDYQGVYVVINTRIRRDEYNWGVESVNEDYQLRFTFIVNTTSSGLKTLLNETIDTGAIDLATWTEFKWRLKLPVDFIDSASDKFQIDVIAPHPKDGSTVRYNVVAVDYIRFTMYEPLNTFYASPSAGVVMKSDPFNYFQFTDSLTELKVDNLLINGYRPPRYRGELSADPTYDNVPGDEYYNSTTSKLKKYITSVGYINLN